MAHRVGDGGADVATLRDVAGVAKAAHQLRPGERHAAWTFQPTSVGSLEKPKPGSDGITRSNASSARPAVRRWIRQRADDPEYLNHRAGPAMRDDQREGISGCDERTWMKWMSTPSISVMNCGSAFNFASTPRQLYSVAQ